jgi:DNA-binding XRE family transcriptional regulator
MRPKPRPASVPSDSAIVAKAALRAAERLDVTNKLLARIIGVSEATVSRMRRGDYPLENKPFELAIMFIRLYRSLDAVIGGDDAVAKA